jgi:DNA-binding XRE family transcriptional regulator
MTRQELKTIRHSVGLTQIQFAKAMNVSFATLNRWERGHCEIHEKYHKVIRGMMCKRKSQARFKPMQIVIAETEDNGKYPWWKGDAFLYLGEIKQMPGHVAVVDRKGKIHWAYHDDDFREPMENEV